MSQFPPGSDAKTNVPGLPPSGVGSATRSGAAGGGYSQVVPMEDLNLHLTGDFHAVTAAQNLCAAMLDASLLHGNQLRLDPLQITWRRCLDSNDRALRDIVIGLGGKPHGVPRESSFVITAALQQPLRSQFLQGVPAAWQNASAA